MTKDEIQFGEACGLTYTNDPEFPFIGTDEAWSKYNDGDDSFCEPEPMDVYKAHVEAELCEC